MYMNLYFHRERASARKRRESQRDLCFIVIYIDLDMSTVKPRACTFGSWMCLCLCLCLRDISICTCALAPIIRTYLLPSACSHCAASAVEPRQVSHTAGSARGGSWDPAPDLREVGERGRRGEDAGDRRKEGDGDPGISTAGPPEVPTNSRADREGMNEDGRGGQVSRIQTVIALGKNSCARKEFLTREPAVRRNVLARQIREARGG